MSRMQLVYGDPIGDSGGINTVPSLSCLLPVFCQCSPKVKPKWQPEGQGAPRFMCLGGQSGSRGASGRFSSQVVVRERVVRKRVKSATSPAFLVGVVMSRRTQGNTEDVQRSEEEHEVSSLEHHF